MGKVEIVGFGSYGEVKLARNTENGDVVAIKMVLIMRGRSTIKMPRKKSTFTTNWIIPTSSNSWTTTTKKKKTPLTWCWNMLREGLSTTKSSSDMDSSASPSFDATSETSAKQSTTYTATTSCIGTSRLKISWLLTTTGPNYVILGLPPSWSIVALSAGPSSTWHQKWFRKSPMTTK